TSTPSSTWSPVLGSIAPVKSAANSRLAFIVPPLSAVVLRADNDLPNRAAPRPALRFGADPLSGTLKVASATVATADPVSVTFAARRGSGRWARLASDDSPPYRAFVEPGRYLKGERIDLVAIATATDGSAAVSPVLRVTPRR